MLRLASDEDVRGGIIRGLRRRAPGLDIVRVQDVGLKHTYDPFILAWAAGEGRVLITADRNTMVGFAYARVKAMQPMPGVLALGEKAGIGQTIEDILLVRGATQRMKLKTKSCTSPYDSPAFVPRLLSRRPT